MTAATGERRPMVVVPELVTLDGYIVGPDEDIGWVVEGFHPQMQEDIAATWRRSTSSSSAG